MSFQSKTRRIDHVIWVGTTTYLGIVFCIAAFKSDLFQFELAAQVDRGHNVPAPRHTHE